jgi:hypothetical protein
MALFGQQTAHEVEVGGRTLQCEICKGSQFRHRKAQLNTAAATFFNLDWANRSANCYVCDRCGYVHWFLPK